MIQYKNRNLRKKKSTQILKLINIVKQKMCMSFTLIKMAAPQNFGVLAKVVNTLYFFFYFCLHFNILTLY